MIKAVIFDIDGVLVDSREANVALYQNLLAKAGYPVPSTEKILSNFHLTARDSLRDFTGSDDPEELDRLMTLVASSSVRRPELFKFPQHLEQSLSELKIRYQLAIVTGRIKIGVDELFRARPIKEYFEQVISYADYSKPKPDPESLLLATERLKVHAQEAIYVGDSNIDIEAANSAKMKSVYLGPTKNPNATVSIEVFSDVVRAVRRIAT